MGEKKKAALHGLSKKDRRKLEEREAKIAAELKRREKIAKKSKGKKKAKKAEPEKVGKKPSKKLKAKIEKAVEQYPTAGVEPMEFTATPEAPIEPEIPSYVENEAVQIETPAEVKDRAKPLKGKALKAAMKADVEKAKARAAAEAESDEEIRARVQAKRAAREAGGAEKPGSPERLADMIEKVKKGKAERAEKDTAKAGDRFTKRNADGSVEKLVAVEGEGIVHVAEVVETDHGREIAVGPASDVAEEFAQPSEAPHEPELESGRNGYKIIQLDAEGKPDPRKIRQMTRVSTFVNNIDDETSLKLWEKRLLLEGVSLNATEPRESVPYVVEARDIVHRRDVAIAKALKADRKGKLGIGEVGHLVRNAEKAAKDALNALVDEALEAAGRHAKAEAGTNLHSLAEIRDAEGMGPIDAKLEAGEISETDHASIAAYDARMTRLGAKVIESEAVVVNDEMGYAGRLDRVLMCKLPELVIGRGTPNEYTRPADVHSKRYVSDIKSGSLEYGAGKIARQMTAYAHGKLYNVETGERTRHSAATDVGLVFHLPQGEGKCHVYAVDLKSGLALLKLSADVRRARNTGKKTIDLSVDIADPEPGE